MPEHVYVITISDHETSWIAGVYQSEDRARTECPTLSHHCSPDESVHIVRVRVDDTARFYGAGKTVSEYEAGEMMW